MPPACVARALHCRCKGLDADLPGEINISLAMPLKHIGGEGLLNVIISSQQEESISFTCCKLSVEQGNLGPGSCK